jgi:hypothetical protein
LRFAPIYRSSILYEDTDTRISMSSLALSQLHHDTRAFLRALSDRWDAFVTNVAEARAIAERFESLSRFSDAELARHGLKRPDIARVVFAGARR